MSGDFGIFNPFVFHQPDDIDECFSDYYYPKFTPHDSGFDRTLEVVNCQRRMADLAILFYSYIVTTCQISNFLNYCNGRNFEDFVPRKPL